MGKECRGAQQEVDMTDSGVAQPMGWSVVAAI